MLRGFFHRDNMLREFLHMFIPKINVRTAVIRPHIIPFLCVVGLMMAFYLASRFIAPGWVTYVLSSLCLGLVGITALARVNDISSTETSLRWQVRRAGLVLVGASCLGLILSPWMNLPIREFVDFPTWRVVMLRLGIALTWVTTPMMPPWHHYITGEYKKIRIEVPNDVAVDITRTEITPYTSESIYEDRLK